MNHASPTSTKYGGFHNRMADGGGKNFSIMPSNLNHKNGLADSFYSSKTQRGMDDKLSPLTKSKNIINKDLEQEFSESTFENQRQHLDNSILSKIS